MNKELFNALRALEEEKGIPQAYMIEKIEAALVSAYKKEYGNNTNVRVVIDPVKDDIKVYQQKLVVEEITNPQTEISLEDAKTYSKRHTVGKLIDIEVKPKNFRRLSAMAAKSVIIQGIRESERRVAQEAYESKWEEIITATVLKVDPINGNIVLGDSIIFCDRIVLSGGVIGKNLLCNSFNPLCIKLSSGLDRFCEVKFFGELLVCIPALERHAVFIIKCEWLENFSAFNLLITNHLIAVVISHSSHEKQERKERIEAGVRVVSGEE